VSWQFQKWKVTLRTILANCARRWIPRWLKRVVKIKVRLGLCKGVQRGSAIMFVVQNNLRGKTVRLQLVPTASNRPPATIALRNRALHPCSFRARLGRDSWRMDHATMFTHTPCPHPQVTTVSLPCIVE
jgi:hypothetical protein